METNNYPVGLLGGHPEFLHCVGEKELHRKKSLIQTTLEEDEISGSLEHRRPRYNILSGRSYGNGEHHRVANHTSWDNWWIEEH